MSTTTHEDEYAVTGWNFSEKFFDLTLPSGQRCQVRKLEMEDILRMNLVNELDTFSAAIQVGDDKDDKRSDEERGTDVMKKLTEQADGLSKFQGTMDKVIMECVQKPSVQPAPKGNSKRKPGVAYIDAIGFMDKMTIFSAVFDGMSDMESFRAESEDAVGAVESESSGEVSSV